MSRSKPCRAPVGVVEKLLDAYEREARSPDYFQHFSVPGYAIGIDVLLYAMTH